MEIVKDSYLANKVDLLRRRQLLRGVARGGREARAEEPARRRRTRCRKWSPPTPSPPSRSTACSPSGSSSRATRCGSSSTRSGPTSRPRRRFSIAKTMILPAGAAHLALIRQRASPGVETEVRELVDELVDTLGELKEANASPDELEGLDQAKYARDRQLAAMSKVREAADKLEGSSPTTSGRCRSTRRCSSSSSAGERVRQDSGPSCRRPRARGRHSSSPGSKSLLCSGGSLIAQRISQNAAGTDDRDQAAERPAPRPLRPPELGRERGSLIGRRQAGATGERVEVGEQLEQPRLRALRRRSRSRSPARRSAVARRRPGARRGRARRSSSRCSSSGCAPRRRAHVGERLVGVGEDDLAPPPCPSRGWRRPGRRPRARARSGRCARARSAPGTRAGGRAGERLLAGLAGGLVGTTASKCARSAAARRRCGRDARAQRQAPRSGARRSGDRPARWAARKTFCWAWVPCGICAAM